MKNTRVGMGGADAGTSQCGGVASINMASPACMHMWNMHILNLQRGPAHLLCQQRAKET